ncbi:hypothetical protein GCM10027072_66410 [Streptomyces bullii]
MAPGVREAFRTLYRKHVPDVSEADAERWLRGRLTRRGGVGARWWTPGNGPGTP